MTELAFCDRCGRPAVDGGHQTCRVSRGWEPPRFCPRCARRMTVQVTPLSWTAVCVQHGTMRGTGA